MKYVTDKWIFLLWLSVADGSHQMSQRPDRIYHSVSLSLVFLCQ